MSMVMIEGFHTEEPVNFRGMGRFHGMLGLTSDSG